MRGIKKQHLPEKTCAACGRSFTWRKKWERVWDEVKFCSDRCRATAKQARAASSPESDAQTVDSNTPPPNSLPPS
jgi:hypothetical protein